MSTNHTTNYNLNQWEAADKVLRTEFNEDNAKIDAALKSHDDELAGLEAAIGARGNCRVEVKTYTGTGTYGSSNRTSVSFSAVPKLAILIGGSGLAFLLGGNTKSAYLMDSTSTPYPSMGALNLSWSGSTASYYSSSGARYQFNDSGTQYWAIALLAQDET